MNPFTWDWVHIWNFPGVKLMAIGIAIYILGILVLAHNPKGLKEYLTWWHKALNPKEEEKKRR